MEKIALNGNTEKLKANIYAASKKSKETIKGIIDASSIQFESALDTNKKFIQTIEKQFFNQEMVDYNLVSDLNKTFGNSVELSEEAIDTIIDMQSAQLQAAIDMNTKLINTLNNFDFSNREDRESLVNIIDKNLEDASNLLTENTKKMTDIYNRHINLALNFNERFSKNIDKRLEMINKFQSKNMDMFNDWATHWWKTTTKEEAAV